MDSSKSFKKLKLLTYFLLICIICGSAYLWHQGSLNSVIEFLNSNSLALEVGDYKVTPLKVLKTFFAVVILFWLATKISRFSSSRISKLRKISSSSRSLIIKTVNIVIYFVVFLLILDVIGIDLTALTVFSGAVGIGLGFGLQKITSNFISGIIMLFERSIEEGDVVELESGVYGYVRNTTARYTLVETYDGKEIMIPNEEFIINRVTNWTYSNSRGRLELNIGVSYDSDLHKVREIIMDAVKSHPMTSNVEEPKVHLFEFGDSSVNFLIFVWSEDISNARYRMKSDILFKIWDDFKANNIEIPFPQRDIHIRTDNTK